MPQPVTLSADGLLFLKTMHDPPADFFDREAAGLNALRSATATQRLAPSTLRPQRAQSSRVGSGVDAVVSGFDEVTFSAYVDVSSSHGARATLKQLVMS